MTTRGKIATGVAVCVAVLLCGAVAFLLYAVHDADRYLPRIVAYARQKTGLDIGIRRCSVGLFPLTVRLYDVEIKNPKPFPAGDFLKAPMVEAALAVGPLVQRKVAFKSIVLDRPVMDFISDPDGLWNFQNPATPKQATHKPPRLSMGPIGNVQVKNGTLLGSALIDPADTPGPLVFEVQNFSGELKQIKFDAFKAPNASAPILGKLHADTAAFGDVHLKNVRSDLRILPEQLTFKGFQAETYRGKADGDFTFDFAGKKTQFKTDVVVTGIGPGYLLKEFVKGPAVVNGMMKANFRLAGEIEHTANPLAGIDGGGQFTIGKGELPGLDQDKNVVEMKRFRTAAAAGLPPSAFSSFAADIELKNHHILSKQIRIDFYGVDVSGSGDMNELNGGLNYRGSVVILKKQGFFTDVVARMFKQAKMKDGRLNFKLRLTGTWNNPDLIVVK